MRGLIGLFVCLLLAGSAAGRIITVDDDGGGDFGTIQGAINDANDGDTVEVRPGTYRGAWNRDIDFLGKAITVRSINPEDANVVAATVVDCNGIDVQKHRAFIFASGEEGDSMLSGLTLTNGYAPGRGSYDEDYHGGAVYCENSSPTISYCVIRDSTARGYRARGSAVYCSNSQATFSHCIITGNRVVDYYYANGGAVYCSDSEVILSHCIIAYNSASLSPTGGIEVEKESAVSIRESIIWANSGEDGSQIILEDDSILTVSYSDIQGGPDSILLRHLDYPRRVPPGQEGELNWGPGNIDADPRFVDPNGGDYHLSLHSLCINAGDPNFVAGAGQTDMDGEGRTINGRIDIGPDEVDYEGPLLAVNPSIWLFDANEGGPNPEALMLSVYNSGPGTINWEIDYDCNWLHVEPTSGAWEGDSDEVPVSVDVNGMDVGLYHARVWVRSAGVASSPQSLTVSLHIRGMSVDVPADYPTIQAAIDDVLEGGTVTVADGTYTGEGNQDIDFRGKAITVRSESGAENCVIDVNGSDYDWRGSRGFHFHSGEDCNSVLSGFTITNAVVSSCPATPGGAGILCSLSSPTIRDCVIVNNFAWGWCIVPGSAGGGVFLEQSNARIANCLIVGNISNEGGFGAGIYCLESSPIITNCTICDNLGHGITVCNGSSPVIVNSILWGNLDGQISVGWRCYNPDSLPVVVFSNVQNGWGGLGNIAEDPCFVSAGYFEPSGYPYSIYDDTWIEGDYHLLSEGWRWATQRGVWTWDDVTSRCIDAGDPDSPLGDEPLSVPGDPNKEWGENVRTNMGVYGGRAQASMAPSGWAIRKDYNNDGIANWTDFACRSDNQVSSSGEGTRRDCSDLAVFAQCWLARTTWFEAPATVPAQLPGKAADPYPGDGATGVRRDTGESYRPLNWDSDLHTASHDVYFGKTNPPPFLKNQTYVGLYLDEWLEAETTYYWRIDEKNGLGTTVGDVWTFTTGDR